MEKYFQEIVVDWIKNYPLHLPNEVINDIIMQAEEDETEDYKDGDVPNVRMEPVAGQKRKYVVTHTVRAPVSIRGAMPASTSTPAPPEPAPVSVATPVQAPVPTPVQAPAQSHTPASAQAPARSHVPIPAPVPASVLSHELAPAPVLGHSHAPTQAQAQVSTSKLTARPRIITAGTFHPHVLILISSNGRNLTKSPDSWTENVMKVMGIYRSQTQAAFRKYEVMRELMNAGRKNVHVIVRAVEESAPAQSHAPEPVPSNEPAPAPVLGHSHAPTQAQAQVATSKLTARPRIITALTFHPHVLILISSNGRNLSRSPDSWTENVMKVMEIYRSRIQATFGKYEVMRKLMNAGRKNVHVIVRAVEESALTHSELLRIARKHDQ